MKDFKFSEIILLAIAGLACLVGLARVLLFLFK